MKLSKQVAALEEKYRHLCEDMATLPDVNSELELLIKTFKHVFEDPAGHSDTCHSCGLDIRNVIHERSNNP